MSTDRRTPSTFSDPAKAKHGDAPSTARDQQTARNENNDPNHCPVCNRAYQVSRANGHPVLVCLHDNIVMPVKD
jgi:hypothetical protein